ncbi:MAG: hypothetical protein U1E65_26485 [Myxococcota bacterium]
MQLALWLLLSLAAEPSAREQALRLFDQSEAEYQSGHFQEAATLLEQAYALHPQPILLYNLARAKEGAGDYPGAIDAYRRYLAEAKEVRDRGAIEGRVLTLEKTVRERAALLEPRPSPPPAVPPPIAAPSPEPPPRVGPVPLVIGGLGVLGLGAGIIVGSVALSDHQSAAAAPDQARAAALQTSAEDLGRAANLTFVGSALAIAIGASVLAFELWSGP